MELQAEVDKSKRKGRAKKDKEWVNVLDKVRKDRSSGLPNTDEEHMLDESTILSGSANTDQYEERMLDEASKQETSGLPKMEREAKDERLRMWSAISFSVLILGAGLPLWWRTTEVTRVPLPLDRIEALAARAPRVRLEVTVVGEDAQRVGEVGKALRRSGLFNVFTAVLNKSYEEVEAAESSDYGKPGTLTLRQTRDLPSAVLLGNGRTIYFSPTVTDNTLATAVGEAVLEETRLESMLKALEKPGTPGKDPRLKSEPCFDLLLSVVHPEPHNVRVEFDAESASRYVISPMLSQLSSAVRLRVKSQWLHYLDLGVEAKKIPNGPGWEIPQERVAHVVSPLEKKLGSGVSSCACLHFVLYVARCSESPLRFGHGSDPLLHVVSPKWGGIQILNPGVEHCRNYSALEVNVVEVARTLASQLRQLLGLRREFPGGVAALPLGKNLLRGWELDALYRSRALEQTVSARLTLLSLARLLGEISNIVINDEVGDAIRGAVDSIQLALDQLEENHLSEALRAADEAFVSAESAFGHPSLLALLYFPDDQKYAVYIPLFLPVMIPVVLSLKTIYRWAMGKE